MSETTPTTTSASVPAQPEPGAVPISGEKQVAGLGSTKAENPKVGEPQSALTKKFTDAEWKAVKEFRYNLPSVFADAFPDNPNAKTTPIKIWGVTVDPLDPIDARVSVILRKFLHVKHLNVTEAQSMLISTLRWRDTFKPEEAMNEKFPPEIFGSLGRVFGKDLGGRPITYNVYGACKDFKAIFSDVQRFIRWRVGLMEKAVCLLDFENVDQIVQIHDYEGVSMTSHNTNSKNSAQEVSSIFAGHYPDLLHKKFFVNGPMMMTWGFWAFSSVLSKETRDRMTVVGSGRETIGNALLPHIAAEELPEEYGGTA